jgi:hypothetical protein
MESKASRSTLTIIFLASLLLHSTLGLLILTIKYAQNTEPHNPADIVFYEEEQTPPTSTTMLSQQEQSPTKHEQEKAVVQEPKQEDDDFFKNFPKMLPNATSTAQANQPPESMAGQSLVSAPLEKELHQEKAHQTETTKDSKDQAKKAQQELEQKIDETSLANISEQENSQSVEHKKASPVIKKETAQAGSYGVDHQVNNVTLAQIAKSFLDEAQNNHQSFETSAHIEGDSSALPSGKHFAFARYWEKINYHVLNELKLHFGNYQHICSKRWPNMFFLRGTMKLNKQGAILTAELSSSTGSAELDAFLLELLKEASSSFPPIPQSLGQETLNVPWHWPLPTPEQSRLRRI